MTAQEILSLADSWAREEDNRAVCNNRKILEEHFNSTRTREDDEDIVNFGIGRGRLDAASRALFDIYNQSNPIEVKFRKKEWAGEKARKYSRACSQALSLVIKQSGRWATDYKALCGDAALTGSGFLLKTDRYDWRLRRAILIHAPDASADLANGGFTQWAARDELSISDLERASRAKGGYWKAKEARRLLLYLAEGKNTSYEKDSGFFCFTHYGDKEEKKYTLPVLWFFKMGEDGAVSKYCVAPRVGEDRDKNKNHGFLLVKKEKCFDSVDRCLFPFLLDMRLGGSLKINQSLGLGHLLYDPDDLTNRLLYSAFVAYEEEMTTTYQFADPLAQSSALERQLKNGFKRGQVAPPGLSVFERPRGTQRFDVLAQLLAYTQGNIQEKSQSSTGLASNPAGGEQELVVQALERQSQNRNAFNQRFSEWYRFLDKAFLEITRFFIDPDILPVDDGHREWKAFRAELEERGVSASILGEIDFDRDVEVRARRLGGNGDRGEALERIRAALPIVADQPAAARSLNKRALALTLDDESWASELLPEIETPEESEQEAARQAREENNAALLYFAEPQIIPGELTQVHVVEHFTALGNVLDGASGGGLSPREARGWEVLAGHTEATIARVSNKEQAKKLLGTLVQMASAWRRLAALGQPDSTEQQKIDLKRREIELKERAQGAIEFHRDRSQQTREQKGAEDFYFKSRRNEREEKEAEARLLERISSYGLNLPNSNNDNG